MRTQAPGRRLRIGLFWRILLAMLVAGLLPLALIGVNALQGYQAATDRAGDAAAKLLDDAALEALKARTTQTAADISRFLESRVQDTRTLALLPRTPAAYRAFDAAHRGALWYEAGSKDQPAERRVQAPLYREIAFIDATGRERLLLRDGAAVPDSQLRDVADPANTSYRDEDYFAQTKALRAGEVYVSRVTAWHASTAAQPAHAAPAGTPDSARYGDYQAVVRFATPVFDEHGAFAGIVMLSLDHRHLMEFSIHILPTAPNRQIAWPDYASGNYAFMFDDEGYTIAHPLLSRIRGVDANGRLLAPLAANMSREEAAKHPFNLKAAGWADASFPRMYDAVLKGESNFTVAINQAGAAKASTYAPIPFAYGVYRERGIFGGLVLGANVSEFHKAATDVRAIIQTEHDQFQGNMLWIVGCATVILAALTLLISRSITRPIQQLTEAAETMERGELDTATLNGLLARRVEDESTKLARVFKQMAEKVQLRERTLKQTIAELHIQIDEQKQAAQVAEITDTDYFRTLQEKAQRLRSRALDQAGSMLTEGGA